MNESRFCEQCGGPLGPGARFCRRCGQPIQALPESPAVSHPAPPSYASAAQSPPLAPPGSEAEPVIGVIAGLIRSKGLMQTETFNLVVTPGRLVFALITQPMINAAVQQARTDAKARGEGLLGQVGAQMAYLDILAERCETLPVEATLADQPNNFFIPHDQIRKVEIKPIDPRRDAPGHYLVIETAAGKYQFTLRGASPAETQQLLEPVLGRVIQ